MPGTSSYQSYPSSVRDQIVTAFEDGDDWRLLAKALQIPRSTATRWTQDREQGKEPVGRRSHRKKMLLENEVAQLVEWIEEDSAVSLSVLQLRLQTEYDKAVSLTTIGNYLDGRLIMMKKMHLISENMNCDINKEKRKVFVRAIQAYRNCGKFFIWMDESSFNLHCRRSRGLARVGDKVRTRTATSRGDNLHIIVAITEEGCLNYTLKRGSYTKISCNACLSRVLHELTEDRKMKAVVVCDNAPCHNDLQSVLMNRELSGIDILKLPPYSPQLNPIEGVWNVVKQSVKNTLLLNYHGIRDGDPTGELFQPEWRIQLLENAARTAVTSVSSELFQQMIARVNSLYPKILDDEDL